MLRHQEPLWGRIGKTLRIRNEEVTREPLPKRWIDLILHLDEQERKQSACSRPEIEPRQVAGAAGKHVRR